MLCNTVIVDKSVRFRYVDRIHVLHTKQLHWGGYMKFVAGYRYCFFLLFVFSTLQLTAQWSGDPQVNNSVSAASNSQLSPAMVSDGAGGAIIVWEDYRSSFWNIYAQRLNSFGQTMWTSNGVAICTAPGTQNTPIIVTDGSGGAIIAWADFRGGSTPDIYAQRINSSGAVQWTSNGVVITTAADSQAFAAMVSDDAGGAILTWQDRRSLTSNDIYAQRINSSGVVQWAANGVVVSTATNNQKFPSIEKDDANGAFVSWQDYRSGTNYDIYAQNINSSGTGVWTADGALVCNATGNQLTPVVARTSQELIVAWTDYRSGTNFDIYAQSIEFYGVNWAANGVVICTATADQLSPKIISDGNYGAIIAWEDRRSASYYIYSQRVDEGGTVQWTANGVAISPSILVPNIPFNIVGDGNSGLIVTFKRYLYTQNDIYAQRINASGTVQWNANGIKICSAPENQDSPDIISDDKGGAIITWDDWRDRGYDIYAQRIELLGNLYASPNLDKVADITNDQGGKLRLFWEPSTFDAWNNTTVKSYTIKMGARTTGILGKTSESNGTGIYWQTAGIVSADKSEAYSAVVNTYADSGLQGTPYYYFQIIAKNSDSSVQFLSNIDSGYSIDNIPPVGVNNAIIASNGEGILLKWDKNRVDKDLMHYGIYRSTTPGFIVGTGTQLTTTTDTTYTDPSGTNGTTYYYRIAAMDVHGNIGAPSNELNETALSLELTSFIVQPNRHNALIEWKAATETNTFGYEIERRAVGQAFLPVSQTRMSDPPWIKAGFVEGSGTSQSPRRYSFTDRNLVNGTFAYRLKHIDRSGQFKFSKAVEVKIGVAPNVFELSQNFPNPFNPSTTIEFTVPATGRTTLKVFNTLGQEVATLYNNEAEAGKYHQVQFNASGLSSGIYVSRLQSGDKIQIMKMMFVK